MKQAIILSGGKGTRLKEISGDVPKPLVDLAGKPVLQHQLELLRRHSIEEVILFTGYRSAAIERFFGDGSGFGVKIGYHVDRAPLGTAGAVLDGWNLLQDEFLVLYGDTMLDVDLGRMCAFHERTEADVTLFVHPNDHPHDSDLVDVDEEGRIVAFHPYPHPDGVFLPNRVNAALYVLNKKALEPWRANQEKLDFAKGLFPRMLSAGAKLYAYQSREYIKDMGTPVRLAKVLKDLESGKVRACSLANPKSAVFLDRDGTLTEQTDYVREPTQLRLASDAGEAVRALNQSDYLAVLTTNQPVIARGEVSFDGLRVIHNKLETLLGREQAYLDAIYYCPHHPDKGFDGEIASLKTRCDCRKPEPGMLLKAAKELGIDLTKSWMIGDTTTDIKTAKNAGVSAVLLRTGYGGNDRKFPELPDFEFFTLSEAVAFITVGAAELTNRLGALTDRIKNPSLVAIGGLARSGKSTVTSLLAKLLRERGFLVTKLTADSWLLASEKRGHGVRERYDYSALETAVRQIKTATEDFMIEVPIYDRELKRPCLPGQVVRCGPRHIVLFEGVVALDVPALREAADFKIFVECDENIRKDRFSREYAVRGLTPRAISKLYEERQMDEEQIIRESAKYADEIVRTS